MWDDLTLTPPIEQAVLGILLASAGQFLNYMVYKTLGEWDNGSC
jgi:hypothetical protein